MTDEKETKARRTATERAREVLDRRKERLLERMSVINTRIAADQGTYEELASELYDINGMLRANAEVPDPVRAK